MPKTIQYNIPSYLVNLEDVELYRKRCRIKSFEGLQSLFDGGSVVTPTEAQRTLTVFIQCLSHDIQCIPYAISTVSSLLTKAQITPSLPVQDWLPSVLAVLNILKTICVGKATKKFREMSFALFLLYPVDVLGTLVTCHCSVIMELFQVYKLKYTSEDETTDEICIFLQKLLTLLPPEHKRKFVEEGVSIWFGELVPAVMTVAHKKNSESNLPLIECLETLSDVLLDIDYFQCPQWRDVVLESICNTIKYPKMIKDQLQKGSHIWHRIWIVLVKILKNQITRNFGTYGTPINSMLPAVEMAFKMDVHNRCRAFMCWDNLIDNFSKETNENCLPKRIKLLLIPLKLNNAKTAETAIAKCQTWWNFIRKFQFKLEKFTNEIMIGFIHLAFGKGATDKKPATPGMGILYSCVTDMCLQAFVQIVGHDNCDCCPDIPKLNGKLMTNKLLASHWDEWMHALKTAVEMTDMVLKECDSGKGTTNVGPMPVLCIWKAFVTAVSELPPNGVRRDMFNGLIQVLVDLTENCNNNDNLSSILFSLTQFLFTKDDCIKNVMLTSKGEELPLRKVLSIILKPGPSEVYKRYDTEKAIEVLRPMTDLAAQTLCADWLIDNLLPSDSSLKLWTALAHTLKDSSKDICTVKVLYELLMWPLKPMHQLSDDKYAAIAWYTMYNLNVKSLSNTDLDKYILEWILKQQENNNIHMKLYITIGLLKKTLIERNDGGVLPEFMENLISQMSDYKELEEAFPILVDTIVVILNTMTRVENMKLGTIALNCVISVLNMFISGRSLLDKASHDPNDTNMYKILHNMFNALELVLKVPAYCTINCIFIDKLIELALSVRKETTFVTFLISKMKLISLNCPNEGVRSKINSLIELQETNEIKAINEFISPVVMKPAKKKETSLFNTVVENGEEYVVVKSSWRFNPRKLTENQKEKFQKKREDIPALYQDLSQSQDEFKLSSWKTDSQDTTSSTSKSEKSMTNDDTTNILKNTENTDIVPKIMENILSVKNTTCEPSSAKIEVTSCDVQPDNKLNKVERSSLSTAKTTKSPRMALKDRVFRNVRNLIEKSTPNKNRSNDIIIDECQIGDVPKTLLLNKNNNANLTNFVPTERPSRVKRTPKKFDDVKLFPLKKARTSHSNSQLDTNMDVLNEDMNNKQVSDKTDENIDINNTTVDQDILNVSTEVKICEGVTRTAEVKDSVQDIPEPEVAIVSEPANVASDASITKNEYYNRPSDVAQDNQTSDVIQDKHRNENKEPILNNNLMISLDSEPINDNIIPVTLKTPAKKTKEATQRSSTKKSRIEKELAIDMVEGHPFLRVEPEKRLTRTNKRKSLTVKLHKTKKEYEISPKTGKKLKEKGKSTPSSSGSSVTVEETQERRSSSPESASTTDDAPCSEDVIESSQDSTFTTISVKSTKRTPVRLPNVAVCEKIDAILPNLKNTGTQDLLHDTDSEVLTIANLSENQETKDDTELPQNKTAEVDKNQSVLIEDMDTEPIAENNMSAIDDVIVLNDDDSPTIVNSEESVGPETQEIAEADTQPNDPADVVAFDNIGTTINLEITNIPVAATEYVTVDRNAPVSDCDIQVDDIDMSAELNDPLAPCDQDTDMCSPFKDDVQRKQDFLNNTSEISPIKGQGPDKEKTPSPQRKVETSNDFMVVKLSSPVQINGEPFDKCASPEFFTEDKVSPDKRDQSPPRAEVIANSGSPSSSLSLKKNRPQTMRPGGRAAHMLGLCVPDSLNTIKNSEKVEPEEPKKGNISIPARRNLRVLYNAVGENSDNLGETDEHVNFLKFKKGLPPIDCSPSVPILKRKLIDIVDDATASPANKRKRVSFHDPPVSTTVSVQKYIEPGCIKSPSSAQKRLERQITRSYTKSPKRLENAFVKLDTVLFKAVESFTEDTVGSLTSDTNASLDVTPAVTVVNTSELNDTDPICPDLVECTDSIENIATELSSPAMKELFIQELEGQVGTVGDLAKMTELEVNRLCIKAPKVQIAKKVLADYVNKRAVIAEEVNVPEKMSLADDTALATEMNEEMTESEPTAMSVETQTDNLVDNTALATKVNEAVTEPEPMTMSVETQTDKVSVCDAEIQTRTKIVKLAITQTDVVCTAHNSMQTEESGFKSTSEVISSCLSEREDFVDKLGEHLTETSIRNISGKLSIDTIIDILAMRSDNSTVKLTLNKILERHSQNVPNEEKNSKELTVLRDYLWDRFDSRDLILLCSKLLQKVYDKPA